MKKLFASLLAISLFVPLLHAQKQNIVDVAISNPDFSTLVAALKAADLVDTVKDGTFTVMAPTNKAFENLPDGVLADLLKPENKDKLVAILTYHVVPGTKTVDQLLSGKTFATAQSEELGVAFRDGRVRVNDRAIVQTADIRCENGVLHVIDAVLLPPPSGPASLVDTAVAAGSFNTLVAAVKAAGLVDALSGGGPLTVFAPTDEAFAALPRKTLDQLLSPAGKDQLVDILTYHVVKGNVSAGDALNAKTAPALNGKALAFTFADGAFKVQDAKILNVDIEASNGTIHVIDRVLLPPAAPKKTGSFDIPDMEKAQKLMELAIAHGVPIFNDGDHAGCATVYMAASHHVLKIDALPASVRAPLEASVKAAKQTESARERAWVLRGGIDKAYRAIEHSEAAMQKKSESARTPAATSPDSAASAPEKVPENATVVIDFTGKNPGAEWKTVNDNVMGGRSKGGPTFTDGNLIFSGSTNTDGGGFSSIRTLPKKWNLGEADGIIARIKGDGRTYQFDVRKRGVSDWTAYRAEFKTEKTWSWRMVKIPFADLKPTVMGRAVKGEAVTSADVEAIGLFIYDKKDGPFKLQVDWIGTYKN